MYNFLKYLLMPFFHIFWRIEITGQRNLPKDKPLIIAANHVNNLDPLILAITFDRVINFIGKIELFKNPILKFILDHTNVIPIDRSKGDIKAMKRILRVLKNKNVLGIFPQGTRVKDNEPDLGAKSGLGMFAMMGKSSIVPVSIIPEKNYKLFSKVKVVIHDVYEIPEDIKDKNMENFTLISNQVMDVIFSSINK